MGCLDRGQCEGVVGPMVLSVEAQQRQLVLLFCVWIHQEDDNVDDDRES